MNLPPKHKPIPPLAAADIAEQRGLMRAASRIRKYHARMKPFVWDGASRFPDTVGGKSSDEASLDHDLEYYAGGTKEERFVADCEFAARLVSRCKYSVELSHSMFEGVRAGGGNTKASYGWGFGLRK